MAFVFTSAAALSAREAARKDATMIAGASAIGILLLLAAVHVYWAAGGKAGKAAAVPTAEGRAVIGPSALGMAMVTAGSCLIVAILAMVILILVALVVAALVLTILVLPILVLSILVRSAVLCFHRSA